jgi:hypothetical protein
MKKFVLVPYKQWESFSPPSKPSGLDRSIYNTVKRTDLSKEQQIEKYSALLAPENQIGGGVSGASIEIEKPTRPNPISEPVESTDRDNITQQTSSLPESTPPDTPTTIEVPPVLGPIAEQVDRSTPHNTPPPPGLRESNWRDNWIKY